MAKEKVTYDAETGEVLESKSVAISEKAASGVMVGGQAFKIVQQVNLPTLKQETGETIAIRFDGPFVYSDNEFEEEVEIEGKKVRATRKTSIAVARVTELSTRQQFNYVGNAMTVDNLESAYPENGYVGKFFAIKKMGVVAGKRYKQTLVVEIEPREEVAA